MKRVDYVNISFLTEDRIADALMDYARALAEEATADVVRIPGVDGDGIVREYELVVGPDSQIVTRAVDDQPVPMKVDAALEDLGRQRAQKLPVQEDLVPFGLPADDPNATDPQP